MRRKWILIALAVGLLTLALGGGAALAWGGGHGLGWGWGRGNHHERDAAVAAKVAEILGTDADTTAAAIAQARQEVKEETAQAALDDLAGRVAAILGTDAAATAAAIKKVSQEMSSEALEEKLQSALDDGRITEEQAQEYRDKAALHGGWYGFGHGRRGVSQEFYDRVGDEMDVDGDDVKDAIEQAMSDIQSEAVEAKLQAAVDSGKITQEEADEIRAKIESGEWKDFGKRSRHGKHGGKGRGGRGHHGAEHSGKEPTATPSASEDIASH